MVFIVCRLTNVVANLSTQQNIQIIIHLSSLYIHSTNYCEINMERRCYTRQVKDITELSALVIYIVENNGAIFFTDRLSDRYCYRRHILLFITCYRSFTNCQYVHVQCRFSSKTPITYRYIHSSMYYNVSSLLLLIAYRR